MKPINLHSLISAKNNLSEQNFRNYLSIFGLQLSDKGAHEGIKPHELLSLESFVSAISSVASIEFDDKSYFLLDGYYLGYTIPQIGKEFDLLRFGIDSVINIEVKQTANVDSLLRQLLKNRYYLSFLNERLHLFSFVADTGMLYRLVDNDLIEAQLTDIRKLLYNQRTKNQGVIENLFDPSNYLVSPFNSTEAFVNDNYFLTDHQQRIKEDVFAKIRKNIKFFSITGSAGTGKTLLTYDIAKHALNEGLEVMVIHGGGLNAGQYKLIDEYGWKIYNPKDALKNDFNTYDIIVIDEAQRIYKDQLEYIIELVNETKAKSIFSYDFKQCLRSTETSNRNDIRIEEICTNNSYSLTTKIRTNKVIASFIKKLLDKGSCDNIISYPNIEVCYCKTVDEVLNISELLNMKGWQVINYTPGIKTTFHYEKYGIGRRDCSHSVIGQEFDNVAVVIDDNFTYNDNKLTTKGKYNGYYSQRQMLFQNLTRTRKKLFIIIFNNEEVLEHCMEILNHN